jgi:hypothetical protein
MQQIHDGSVDVSRVGDEPKEFVLRKNEACERLLQRLDALGIQEFRILICMTDGVCRGCYPTRTVFRGGRRYSPARLYDVLALQYELGFLVSDSIRDSLCDTPLDGSEWIAESIVCLTGERLINASVSAVVSAAHSEETVVPLY